jgi:hypothetical protein
MWDMALAWRLFPSLLILAASLVARPALAYHEAHMTADDVRVTVDDAARARVDHALTVRVVSGTLKSLDVSGVEPEAVADGEAAITSENGRPTSAVVEPVGERVLRLTVAEPKGLPRGTYVVHVRYQVDLVKARELVTDGALWKLVWTAPVALEGFDAARVTFDLPAAATEPRALSADGTTGDDGRLATLRRSADRDELEMVRPHVARGEAPVWALRVDPRAFGAVTDPSMRPPPPPVVAPPARFAHLAWLGVVAAVGLAFAALVARKRRAVLAACRARGVLPLPLVARVPQWAHAPLAGAAFAGGVAAQLAGAPTLGAIAVACAMALATFRAPSVRPPVRGPGKWLALAPAEAFATSARSGDGHGPDPRDPLDLGSPRGKIVVLVGALALAAMAGVLRRLDAEYPYLIAIDALALIPIFVTGTARQLPPDLAAAPAKLLAALHATLKKDASLRVAPWARVPLGADHADELRLLVLPRAAMPGLGGIEIGQAWRRTANGFVPMTEVLVRVHDASAAAARLTAIAPSSRAVPGRRPDERVVCLGPALPARRATIALVRRLARELADRRATADRAFSGAERRVPADPRADARVRARARASAVTA